MASSSSPPSQSGAASSAIAPEMAPISDVNVPFEDDEKTTTSNDNTQDSAEDIDIESQQLTPPKTSHWSLIFDQAHVTAEVLAYKYRGSGTTEDPFVVEFLPNDPRNPMLWLKWKKWLYTMTMAFATLAVTVTSTAYTGGVKEIQAHFHASTEIITLGVSLFVLGFAIGPLLWGPFSEMYGRQTLFATTYFMLTIWNVGSALSNSMATLIIMRFLAGAFGSSPLTNAGGVIADLFPANERGLAISVFAAAPFLGPALGPISGGFLGEAAGWRWIEGYLAIFTGVLWIFACFTVPETYAPVILRRRAARLSKKTGKVYKSAVEIKQGAKTLVHELKIALSRPWILLFKEPIVFLLSIYMAIIYGTMYMCFAAFPIVYQQGRGWSEGIGGLAFLGILTGMLSGVAYNIPDNNRYIRSSKKNGGAAHPEARLPPGMVGSVALPIGLFWFAWTNSPHLHWIISIIGTIPFGFGIMLVFLSLFNYLIDTYTIYAASVLAANSVLRSLFGAAFPLFTTYMYNRLGIHWASSIPAFLALACVPFPFLFYKYGAQIRMKCKYAAESAEFMKMMMAKKVDDDEKKEEENEGTAQPGEEKKDEERGRGDGVLGGSLGDDSDNMDEHKEEKI